MQTSLKLQQNSILAYTRIAFDGNLRAVQGEAR